MNTSSPCPAGWDYFGDSDKCYYVNSAYPAVDTWSACSDFCGNNSVGMPCVANAGENAFLNSLRQVTGSIYPLALSDQQQDGTLEWRAGCTSSYTNWAYNEPDHGTNEYCAYLWSDGNEWKDAECGHFTNNYQCVCESPPASAPAQMVVYNPCPDGWEYYSADDKCYYINTVDTGINSWNTCRQYCTSNSVKLPCVESARQNHFLNSIRDDADKIAPLGLKDPEDDGSYDWLSGCSSTYTDWDGGSPSSTPGDICAYAWGAGLHWLAKPCDNLNVALQCICEATPETAPAVMVYDPCPTGWEHYPADNKCYYVEPTVRTWVSCRTFCAVNDVNMLCVENSGQNSFLTTLKATYGTTNFPLGFNDIDNDGTYSWPAGCTSSYTDWNSNEPSQWEGREHCAFLWTGSYGWNDVMCNYYYGNQDQTVCACESTPEDAPATMSTANPCPAGWDYFGDSDKCYYFDSTPRTWHQCSDFCDANGVTLPCVESSNENTYLNTQKGAKSFDGVNVGYSKASVGSAFSWTAGCPATYAGWDVANPVSTADYYCAMLKVDGATGEWINYPCDTQYQTGKTCVCESTPAAAPAVMTEPCPTGWHKYVADGKCYYVTSYTSYSWDQCNDFCGDNNVEMICAQNIGQANFVRSLADFNWVALGLKDSVGDGSYTWYAGCTSSYIAWASGEPTSGTEHCAAIAPDGYADTYCSQPGQFLKCGCESTPPLAPTLMVNELKPAQPRMLSSHSYVVRNGFAFAALANDTTVHTWGEAGTGGNSTAVQFFLQPGVAGIVHSRYAFAALAFDGSVFGWGNPSALVNAPTLDTIILLIGNEGAFASRSELSRGVAFGSRHSGGVIPPAYTDLLASPNLRALAASSAAFAALMSDSTVFAWGSVHTGGGDNLNPVPGLSDVVKVVANREAFAAIDSYGRVTTWGAALAGGDSSSVASALTQVVHVIGTRSAFAAFKADGSLVVWGYAKDGGDASAVAASLTSGVIAVSHTYTAMAALKSDGTAVTWGRETDGGDSSGVSLVNLVSITGNSKAFAAITTSGGVKVWGRAALGGTIPASKVAALASGVVAVYRTDRAFAALKVDGSVVAWGQAGHGGSPGAPVEALLTSGVHTVCANDAAFSAINDDGDVIAWGHATIVPVPGVVYQSNSLKKPVSCDAVLGGAARGSPVGGGDGGGGGGNPTRY